MAPCPTSLTTVLAAALVLAAAGCGDDDRNCGIYEPRGSKDDFTLALGEQSGYRLDEQVRCERAVVPTYWIGIAGTGTHGFVEGSNAECMASAASPICDIDRAAFVIQTNAALDGAGAPSQAHLRDRIPIGGWRCSDPAPSVWVSLYDWRIADIAASTLAGEIASSDMAEYVGVMISGSEALCE